MEIRCHQCACTRREFFDSPEEILVPGPAGDRNLLAMDGWAANMGCCSMSRGFLQAAARDFCRWQELVIQEQEREDLRTGKPLSETMTPGWSQKRQAWRERGYGE